MSQAAKWLRWRPTPAGGIAGIMVIVGLALALFDVNWWFLAPAGVGTVGPGVLRDQDEFQRRAATCRCCGSRGCSAR